MDLSLAATALLLVVSFGFYPTQKPSTENVMASTTHMKKVVRQQSATVTTRQMSTMTSNNRNTKTQAAKQSKDNLAPLRDAWGG